MKHIENYFPYAYLFVKIAKKHIVSSAVYDRILIIRLNKMNRNRMLVFVIILIVR